MVVGGGWFITPQVVSEVLESRGPWQGSGGEFRGPVITFASVTYCFVEEHSSGVSRSPFILSANRFSHNSILS